MKGASDKVAERSKCDFMLLKPDTRGRMPGYDIGITEKKPDIFGNFVALCGPSDYKYAAETITIPHV